MNVLDRLKAKRETQGLPSLTVLERLILDCRDPRLQLEAAAELHELKNGRTYGDAKDLSELSRKSV